MKVSSSLRAKVLILLVIPVAISLFLTGDVIRKDWNDYQTSIADADHSEIIHEVSKLIHQLQRERGKSSMYLNQNLEFPELSKQRGEVDPIVQKLSELIKDPHVASQVVSEAANLLPQISKVRAKVENKEPAPEVAKAYGNLIDDFLKLEVLTARSTHFEENLNGPIMLDVAKENAGKLRAQLSNVLGADKALTMSQISTLESLMAAINANIDSPILKVSPAGREKLEKFRKSDDWAQVNIVYWTVMDKAQQGGYGLNSKDFFATITRSIDELSGIVEGDLAGVKSEIFQKLEDAKRDMIIVSVLTALVSIFILVLATMVIRAITKPINEAVDELKTTTETVMSAFQQLRSASHQMSAGTSQSAASLEETVASVEEISSMVNSNASSAKQAADLSKEGCQLAEKGESEIRALVSNMSELSKSSAKIEEIITIIDDIAFQINLLALNAAVEAARAGEQGKGFAVVAEAVRNLAQRSAVAAKDINTLIQENVEKIKFGSQAADASGEALTTIVNSVRNIATLVSEISSSSEEQAKGLAQITKAMNELDKTTQSSAASAEETSSSAESLSEQAGQLQGVVTKLTTIVDGKIKEKSAA